MHSLSSYPQFGPQCLSTFWYSFVNVCQQKKKLPRHNYFTMLLLPARFGLMNLTSCFTRLPYTATVTSTPATGWLSLLPWQPLLTEGPLHRLRPSTSSLHLPFSIYSSNTISTTATCKLATYSQAAREPWGRDERERERER